MDDELRKVDDADYEYRMRDEAKRNRSQPEFTEKYQVPSSRYKSIKSIAFYLQFIKINLKFDAYCVQKWTRSTCKCKPTLEWQISKSCHRLDLSKCPYGWLMVLVFRFTYDIPEHWPLFIVCHLEVGMHSFNYIESQQFQRIHGKPKIEVRIFFIYFALRKSPLKFISSSRR